MVQKLSVQIGLDGAEEIQRQLKDIGKAGQQAFLEIAKAAEQVGGFTKLDPQVVTQQLQAMGITGAEAIGKIQAAVATATRFERVVIGLKTIEDGFQKLEKATDRFANRMARSFGPLGEFAKALGPVGIGLGALAIGFIKAGFTVTEAIDKITQSAARLGIPIEQFDRLREGFERAGISSEAIVEGLANVQQAMVKAASAQLLDAALRGFGAQGTAQLRILEEAAKGTGEAAKLARESLEKLGLPIPNDAAEGLAKLAASGAKLSDVVPTIVEQLRQMPDSLERTQRAVDQLGEKLGFELIGALRTGGIAADQFKQKFTGLTKEQQIAAAQQTQSLNRLNAAWNRFLAAVVSPVLSPLFDWLVDQFPSIQQGIETTVREFRTLGSVITSVWNALQLVFTNPLQALSLLGTAIGNLAGTLAGDIWSSFTNAGTAAIKAVGDAIDWLINKFKEAAGWVGKLFGGGGASSGIPPDTSGGGFARGGLLGGRGSGTSDSNLAWVSRGEHIMPARAVRQPGVLAFLEALRRSGGDLSRVLDGLGRFALGGPVGMPALAGRGGLGGMHPVTIQFPGLAPIGGLRASADVVNELQRAAALAQVRSGGRKPSRYT